MGNRQNFWEEAAAETLPQKANALIERARQKTIEFAEWPMVGAFLLLDQYSGTKREIRETLHRSVEDFRRDLRNDFGGMMDSRLMELEDVQERYEDILRQAGKAYHAPSPTLSEVKAGATRAHNEICAADGALEGRLLGFVRYENMNVIAHFSDLFEPTEYMIANLDQLTGWADQVFHEHTAEYAGARIGGAMQRYLASVIGNLERLRAAS